ncbi:hypothetical protein [Clostridium beijerinckii]|uniref:hypothetical protein n=1 Tax=Clostridium beijerinckii TaxID=1520 RepID=UPI00098C6FB3|nr:hypothetical protein [Clostridium beijerinckii]MBA8937218.1 hypothetical protein [Clostridium beijerinckii]NRU40316.1 hypothetical protein [Clostridium beijerinckii]NSA96407.1 hypothetical protein [Clostridium beijerinckii]OOM60686.1 hypothetical protein CLOBI_29740 [Clostridium beijerinckii]OOM68608.1 hypothetical protein CLBEIC_32650 [Clostridium beijerinckii]
MNSDIKVIKKIRNEIIHHGAKCIIRSDASQVVFNIHIYRQINKLSLPNEFLMVCGGNEYYSISNYMTWMLCILLNYLENFFNEVSRLRANKERIGEKEISEITYTDRLLGHSFSRIQFNYDELKLYQNNLNELLIHIILYEKEMKNLKIN